MTLHQKLIVHNIQLIIFIFNVIFNSIAFQLNLSNFKILKKKRNWNQVTIFLILPASSSKVFGNKLCWSLFVLILLYSELSVVLLPLTADCRISSGCWTGSSISCDMLLEPLPMRNFNLNGAILNRQFFFCFTSNSGTFVTIFYVFFCVCVLFRYFQIPIMFSYLCTWMRPRKAKLKMSGSFIFSFDYFRVVFILVFVCFLCLFVCL